MTKDHRRRCVELEEELPHSKEGSKTQNFAEPEAGLIILSPFPEFFGSIEERFIRSENRPDSPNPMAMLYKASDSKPWKLGIVKAIDNEIIVLS